MDVNRYMARLKQTILICFMLTTVFTVQAEDSLTINKLNKEKWEEISSGLDYTEEKEKPAEKKEKEKVQEEKAPSSSEMNFGAWGAFIKPAFFIVVICLLAFIIAKIVPGMLKKNASVKDTIQTDIEEELQEENIEEWPLQELLSNYQKNGDIRNSIRIYYLMALQLMHLNGFIKWEKDKTNSKYVSEYAAQKDAADFSNLTLLYETTWYGQFIPDEAMFRIAQQQFTMFNAQFRKPNEK